MYKLIVYEKEDGGIGILTPTFECFFAHSLDEIAAKDVPAGRPYIFVDPEDIPTDRTFRDAWEVQIDTPDGVGAESNEFAPKEEA